jgi:hypothetical protein
MKIPFTVDQFFDVFEAYNVAIWPIHVIFYLLGIAAVLYAASNPGIKRSRIVAGILALFWSWIGVAYHFVHFSRINPAARVFGIIFVLQGILFVIVGCVFTGFRFRFVTEPIPIVGVLFILYALVIYPLIGKMSGHSYFHSPVFGVAPCPTTIFTFGLLLWASRQVPLYVLVIPFLWSLVGFSAAINLYVPQDYGLGIAGILGSILVFVRNQKFKRLAQQ